MMDMKHWMAMTVAMAGLPAASAFGDEKDTSAEKEKESWHEYCVAGLKDGVDEATENQLMAVARSSSRQPRVE